MDPILLAMIRARLCTILVRGRAQGARSITAPRLPDRSVTSVLPPPVHSTSCTPTGFAMNKGCFKDDLSCFGVRYGWRANVLMSPSLAFYFGDKQLGSFHTEGIHRLGDRGKGRVEQRHPRV